MWSKAFRPRNRPSFCYGLVYRSLKCRETTGPLFPVRYLCRLLAGYSDRTVRKSFHYLLLQDELYHLAGDMYALVRVLAKQLALVPGYRLGRA